VVEIVLFRQNIDKLKAKKDVDGSIKALGDSDRFVRWRAAEALGEIGDPRAVEVLSELVHDEHEYVRKAAREALRVIRLK
jgi:HEAT repeat protein